MTHPTFDEVLEAIEHLPVDQQGDLVEVVRRRLAEAGRRRVVEEVGQARAEFINGKAKPADVDAIMQRLRS